MIIANYKCPDCQKEIVKEVVGEDGCYVVPRLFCDCNNNREINTMAEMEVVEFMEIE